MLAMNLAIICIAVIFVVNPFRAAAEDNLPVVEYPKITLGNNHFDAKVARFKIASSDLELLSADALQHQIEGSERRDGFTVDQFRDIAQVKLTMSVVYLQKYYPPTLLGLVKVGGKTENPQSRVTWALSALFCFKQGRVALDSFAVLERQIMNFPNCVQTGPLLVSDGKSNVSELRAAATELAQKYFDQSYRRHFICLSQGYIIFGVTSEVTPDVLAESLRDTSGVAMRPCESAISPPTARDAGLSFEDGADGSPVILPYVIGIK